MSEKIKGIAASDGVAIAEAYLLAAPDLTYTRKTITDTNAEISRLDQAVQQSLKNLEQIKNVALKNLGEEEAQVFEAHMMVLQDPELLDQVKDNIKTKQINAEASFAEVTDMFISMFEAMEDNPYMQERAADIKDVSKKVLANLLGVTLPDLSLINKEVIIIAHDLTPSETAQLNKKFVKAFATNIGGRTSHSAIMARSLEIPAVVGTNNILTKVKQGDIVAVNGLSGEITINPSDSEKTALKEVSDKYNAKKAQWELLKNQKTTTLDGKHIELAANIGTPKDVEGVINNGAEGIGLYRTEFLYMDSKNFPTEDEQFEAYKKVLEGMGGKPVVVRTMDIGGDKELPYFELPKEMNPFLGWRALRISISEKGMDMFKTQLRALLRASTYGSLRIMFPMVALLTEFREAIKIYNAVKNDLISEGVKISNDIQVGIMIEIPAAALLADQFAKEVDFFSIGTNDLIQYSMAADRMSEQVSYLYQPYNPSILRLIKMVIDAAHKEGKWVGMCGEMAGDQTAVPLLVGLGMDELSMSATSVLKTRSLIKKLDTKKMQELANKALSLATMEEVLELMKQYVD